MVGVRRVEISKAQLVYGEGIGKQPRPAQPSEALHKGASVRIAASQDYSGEWLATLVEIVELAPQ